MEAHKDKSRDQAEDDRSVIIERAARATWEEAHVMHPNSLSTGFVVF
jgi:hypothetical protein